MGRKCYFERFPSLGGGCWQRTPVWAPLVLQGFGGGGHNTPPTPYRALAGGDSTPHTGPTHPIGRVWGGNNAPSRMGGGGNNAPSRTLGGQ